MTNNELYDITQLGRLSAFITKMRLKWLGHILRFEYNNIVKKLLFWKPMDGNRPVGRPIFRFQDIVKRDAKFCLVKADMTSLERMAQDRNTWSKFVIAAMDRSP